jgi:type VI protein secretion system component Hcp
MTRPLVAWAQGCPAPSGDGLRHRAPEGLFAVADTGPGLMHRGKSAASTVANRRDVVRTAVGLAAAAVLGGAIADRDRAAIAAETDGRVTCKIAGLGSFEALSYAWNSTTSGGGGKGSDKTNVDGVSFVKELDGLSSALARAVATGEPFHKAVLTVNDGTGKVTLTAEMKRVLVSAVSAGGDGDGTMPLEFVTLSFAKVKLSSGKK